MDKYPSACLLAKKSVVVGHWWETENENERITCMMLRWLWLWQWSSNVLECSGTVWYACMTAFFSGHPKRVLKVSGDLLRQPNFWGLASFLSLSLSLYSSILLLLYDMHKYSYHTTLRNI